MITNWDQWGYCPSCHVREGAACRDLRYQHHNRVFARDRPHRDREPAASGRHDGEAARHTGASPQRLARIDKRQLARIVLDGATSAIRAAYPDCHLEVTSEDHLWQQVRIKHRSGMQSPRYFLIRVSEPI